MNSWITYIVIAAIIVLIWLMFSLYNRLKNAMVEFGGSLPPAHPRFFQVFVLMLLAAVGVLYLLKTGLEENFGQLNFIMFAVFPYVAFVIFLIGSIYRYRNRGFQVSSLSSEFLERKKLFWGSQPFHWGLMVLFFGHLIAFLFPRALLAWNGEPVRLLILEVSSFVFGLSALLGLVLLVRRRLQSKRVLMTTNRMDMLVYVTLLVQIVTGLGIAYFVRWGSSWFASTLTPYLRSVFAFDPEVAAVSTMPWWVQLHIISAFFIVAIIPFTRFMHFLVAPIDYLWRGYQLVIWNWSRKSIRDNKAIRYGKKSENN